MAIEAVASSCRKEHARLEGVDIAHEGIRRLQGGERRDHKPIDDEPIRRIACDAKANRLRDLDGTFPREAVRRVPRALDLDADLVLDTFGQDLAPYAFGEPPAAILGNGRPLLLRALI